MSDVETDPLSVPRGAHNLRPDYRPDVDGLRAVAILAVVSYHVLPEQVSGGFLGVDIFFVISGYLISTIIFKSLSVGSFSFMEFYAHRIRRIFPALILVIAFCLLVGWNALLPAEFILLGKHIAASTLFAENFALWKEAGYFDVATSLKPLMHLWSLAIEEQFYLVFPLLVWGAWRFRLNLLALVTLIFAASLAAYVHDLGHKPIAAFFSPKARFWELMAGAIVAHLMLNSAEALQTLRRFAAPAHARFDKASAAMPARGAYPAPVGSLLSVFGLLLLVSVVFGLNRYGPWSNATGELLAVFGAALLILSGPSALVNRFLLSNYVAVFIGLISYPLYLWHWPLLSFLTIVDGEYPETYQRLLAVSISFVLAVLTYRFVERPIRRHRKFAGRITVSLVLASVVLLFLGRHSKYWAPHYDEATNKIMQAWDFSGYRDPQGTYFDEEYQSKALGKNDHSKIMFIGDSHAEQYKPAVQALFETHASVPILPQVIFLVDGALTADLTVKQPVFDKILADKSLSMVIFSVFWALRYESDKIEYAIRCCGDGLMSIVGRGPPALSSASQIDERQKNLENLIVSLKNSGKEVYIVLDNPFGREIAPRYMLKRSVFHQIAVTVSPLSRRDLVARDEPARSSMQKIADDTGATIVDPLDDLCKQDVCPALSADGTPIYKDYDHLSVYGLTHEVRYLDFILRQSGVE